VENWTIITTIGCSNCMLAKTMLKNRNIHFVEMKFHEMSQGDQNYWTTQAKHGMPIIVYNQKVISVAEMLSKLGSGTVSFEIQGGK